MRIKKSNEWKIAFQTWYNYFEYQVMLFELSNAPVNFQGYINKILAEKLDIFVIFYLDNIFIHTKDPSIAHINAVSWVFKEMRKYSLFAHLKKCQFHKDKVCFLRYVVSAQGVQIEDERIKTFKNCLEPKYISDI